MVKVLTFQWDTVWEMILSGIEIIFYTAGPALECVGKVFGASSSSPSWSLHTFPTALQSVNCFHSTQIKAMPVKFKCAMQITESEKYQGETKFISV